MIINNSRYLQQPQPFQKQLYGHVPIRAHHAGSAATDCSQFSRAPEGLIDVWASSSISPPYVDSCATLTLRGNKGAGFKPSIPKNSFLSGHSSVRQVGESTTDYLVEACDAYSPRENDRGGLLTSNPVRSQYFLAGYFDLGAIMSMSEQPHTPTLAQEITAACMDMKHRKSRGLT